MSARQPPGSPVQQLSVGAYAKKYYNGDESRVWAAIASRELSAIILVEAQNQPFTVDRLPPELALKFMAGVEVHSERMPGAEYSPPMDADVWVDCIFRKGAVLVNLPTQDTRRWPWGTYESKNLALLGKAVEEFWLSYDPEDPRTAPKSEVIVDWLMNEHKVSKTLAEAIAQIIRAEDVPSGPRPHVSK